MTRTAGPRRHSKMSTAATLAVIATVLLAVAACARPGIPGAATTGIPTSTTSASTRESSDTVSAAGSPSTTKSTELAPSGYPVPQGVRVDTPSGYDEPVTMHVGDTIAIPADSLDAAGTVAADDGTVLLVLAAIDGDMLIYQAVAVGEQRIFTGRPGYPNGCGPSATCGPGATAPHSVDVTVVA